jgi:penicillin-binding protein 1C
VHRLRRVAFGLLGTLGVVVVGFFLLDRLYPLDLQRLHHNSSMVLFDDGTLGYATLNHEDKWRFPIDIQEIDPRFIAWLIAYEDKRFYQHHGVDLLAIARAIGQWVVHGEIVSGASTLTMQLAKLLNPKPRTLLNKLIEIFRAIQLEQRLTKEDILEAYLTLTPYGGNIEGLFAGSMRYFNKPPKALEADQIALLVALPQSPESYRPDRHPHRAKKVRDRILHNAFSQGIINAFEYNQSIASALPDRLFTLPRSMPHIAQRHLLSTNSHLSQHIKTTIDHTLQHSIESWAKREGATLEKGTTIAVMVARNRDASLMAYLGSHNQMSHKVSGYIDMTRAIRSPGSTLKPFIYAKAIEERLIHPQTIILDEKIRFGDYTPHNFSDEYSGEVTISEALQRSLNIPAIKVLHRIGVEEFIEELKEYLEGEIYIPQSHTTLPVGLGGVGVSLQSLMQLYLALANEGISRPLHYLKNQQNLPQAKRLYTPQSTQKITNILRQIKAPSGYYNERDRIAYKTGTSYGYRDAWSIGYSKEYTIGVWVGRPDNGTQLQKTGSNTASPLLFELFSIVERRFGKSYWSNHLYHTSSNLPDSLRYFDQERKRLENRFEILSPRENSRFKSAGCSDVVVEVLLRGGKPPYYWYLNQDFQGEILQRAFDVTLPYGGATLQIIDSNGEVVTREVWVDTPSC